MLEPFLVRALVASLALGVVAAPLGCLVVWRRMSYFGSTVAHAGLLGVALGIGLGIDLTLGVILVALAIGGALVVLGRQRVLPADSLLGILSHAALAGGLVAALWRTLVAVAVHEELAAAEGFDTQTAEAALVLILAFTIAVAMKIVGVLLIIAFLIMPAAAARPFSATPEAMVGLAALIGAIGSAAGLMLSASIDIPTGPAIVLVLSGFCLVALGWSVARGED